MKSPLSNLLRRFIALLRLRCPHCLEGRVFTGLWQMRENCPACGVTYERETGYFMNAVFIAYLMGLIVLIPVTILLLLLKAPIYCFFLGPALALLLLAPLLFRYSRLLWMHIDEMVDPRP
jgi:uncharacterized protein (DUF983 family)